TYNENFDSMGSSSASYVPGWTAIRAAGSGTVGATLTPAISTGSDTGGNVYSVGSSAASDRAFGTLASGTTVPRMGASLKNSTGGTITSISLSGVMEQWRSGA